MQKLDRPAMAVKTCAVGILSSRGNLADAGDPAVVHRLCAVLGRPKDRLAASARAGSRESRSAIAVDVCPAVLSCPSLNQESRSQ